MTNCGTRPKKLLCCYKKNLGKRLRLFGSLAFYYKIKSFLDISSSTKKCHERFYTTRLHRALYNVFFLSGVCMERHTHTHTHIWGDPSQNTQPVLQHGSVLFCGSTKHIVWCRSHYSENQTARTPKIHKTRKKSQMNSFHHPSRHISISLRWGSLLNVTHFCATNHHIQYSDDLVVCELCVHERVLD